jgi:anti-sigma-K factor RskA
MHDLAAAYALNALDERDRSAFEAHLEGCAECAENVRSFQQTASLLAYGAPTPEPPADLRARVLDVARQERPTQSVVVLRPRRPLRAVVAIAAVFAAAAIGLGVWAATLSNSLDNERAARQADARAAAVLSSASARTVPLGPRSKVVFVPTGDAVMVVRGLPRAPGDRTYEAWVIGPNAKPIPAGLFKGGPQRVVLLQTPVQKGGIVAVTVEPKGGSPQPTTKPILASGET